MLHYNEGGNAFQLTPGDCHGGDRALESSISGRPRDSHLKLNGKRIFGMV